MKNSGSYKMVWILKELFYPIIMIMVIAKIVIFAD